MILGGGRRRWLAVAGGWMLGMLAGSLGWTGALYADEAHPPGQVELKIPSGDAHLNAFMYTAAGVGPHPLLILLHGFPGNERNLDLGQAARQAGWDVLYFDYRGSWGSGGRFSFAHALEDVRHVLGYMRSAELRQRFRIDPERIVLLGHSMGGGLALLAAERDAGVRCTAALAAWNIGAEPEDWRRHPERRQAQTAYFGQVTDPDSGPLRSSAASLRDEVAQAPADWDFVQGAKALSGRPLLLISDTRTPRDMETYTAMVDRLRSLGDARLTAITYVDDHPFSAHRQALQTQLIHWLDASCH